MTTRVHFFASRKAVLDVFVSVPCQSYVSTRITNILRPASQSRSDPSVASSWNRVRHRVLFSTISDPKVCVEYVHTLYILSDSSARISLPESIGDLQDHSNVRTALSRFS